MVTPEASGPGEQAKRSRTRTIGVGVLGLAAGLAAIIALTQSDPPPPANALPTTPSTVPLVEPPSTTATTAPFRVADIVSGPQIDWVGSRQFTDQVIVAVFSQADDFYLFTTPQAPYPEGGLDVWRLRDASWVLLSTVPRGFDPHQVLKTDDGFFTFGTEVNGAPVVWISPDATDWNRVPLPWEEGNYVYFNNVVTTDDLVVIGASGQKDPALLVAQAVADHYPHLRGDLREYPDREPVIVLTVPPFIPVMVVEPEDIGLTASDVYFDWRFDRLTFIGTDGGHRWRRVVAAEDDGTWVNPAFEGPDGTIWGRNHSGDLFRSSDGITWEPVDAVLPDFMTPWGSDVIGVESYDGRGMPILQTSTDLMSWEDFPTPDVLPRLPVWGTDWWDPVLAAGGGGVALAVRTTEHSTRGRDPLRIERDGYTMFAGPTGLFLLKEATPVIMDWEPDSDLWLPARLTEDGTSVIFSDPTTRADLVTFSLEELEPLRTALFGPEKVIIEDDRHVLFFSPDGERWTVQDLSGIATSYGPTSIAVGTESILVITSDFWSAKVWVGQLPARP